MKAKFVYENMKFERGKDPKKSMSIGRYKNYEKYISPKSKKETIEIIYDLLPLILGTDEIPKDILNKKEEKKGIFKGDYFNLMSNYIYEYIITIFNGWGLLLRDKLLDEGYLNENMRFERRGDPKASMSIGRYRNYKKHMTFDSEEEAIEALIELIPLILGTDEIPEDILAYSGLYIREDIFYELKDYIDQYFFRYRLYRFIGKLEKHLRNMGFRYVA